MLAKLTTLGRQHSGLLIFTTLILISGLFSHLLSESYVLDGGRQQVSLPAKLLLALSYLLSASLFLIFWQQFKERVTIVVWLWLALLLWAGMSILLGQFNIYAIIRYAGLVGCTLAGFMLYAATDNIKQVLYVFLWLTVAIVLANIVVLGPSGMIDWTADNVKGLFYQKNLLGHNSFLSMLIASFSFVAFKGGYRYLSVAIFFLAAWLLLLSDSMTSNLLVIIVVMTILAVLLIRRYSWGWQLVLSLLVVMVLTLTIYGAELFNLVGKNTTFTGRTNIWAEYGALIEQRLLFGHGYGAYPEQLTVWLRVGPHSGYVEFIYYLGLVGVSLFFGILVGIIKAACQIIKSQNFAFESYFIMSFLAAFFALNITETYLLNRSGLLWPLFVYLSLHLAWLVQQSGDEEIECKS